MFVTRCYNLAVLPKTDMYTVMNNNCTVCTGAGKGNIQGKTPPCWTRWTFIHHKETDKSNNLLVVCHPRPNQMSCNYYADQRWVY